MFLSEFGIQEELVCLCMSFSRRFSSGVWSLVFFTDSRSIGNSNQMVKYLSLSTEVVIVRMYNSNHDKLCIIFINLSQNIIC